MESYISTDANLESDAARATLGTFYSPSSTAQMDKEPAINKSSIYIEANSVDAGNVDDWAISLTANYAAGITREFIISVPLSITDRLGVRTIAHSKHCSICVNGSKLVLYVGGNRAAFSNSFGKFGLIH